MVGAFSAILGVFNTLGTVIDEISSKFGFNSDDSSVYGAAFIAGGLIGSIVVGVFLEITKKFRVASIIIGISSFCSSLAMALTYPLEESWVTTLFAAIVGLTMVPFLPLSFEYACELTFPIGEAMSGGLLMSSGQITGIIFIYVTTAFLDKYPNSHTGAMISLMIMNGYLLFGVICIAFIKEDLRRFNLDKMDLKRDDAPSEESH